VNTCNEPRLGVVENLINNRSPCCISLCLLLSHTTKPTLFH